MLVTQVQHLKIAQNSNFRGSTCIQRPPAGAIVIVTRSLVAISSGPPICTHTHDQQAGPSSQVVSVHTTKQDLG